MRIAILSMLALLMALPAWAGEWRYEEVDDPSGLAKGRIRYFSGYYDTTPGAYAAFTITGTSAPRLYLTIRLPRELPGPMDRAPYVFVAKQIDGGLDYFVPLQQSDAGDMCAEGWDTAVNCAMRCAASAEAARDDYFLDCGTPGLPQVWLDFRAEFELPHLRKFLDDADAWNAIWFDLEPDAEFYMDLAGFAEALCEHVDVGHEWCGDAAPAVAASAPASSTPSSSSDGSQVSRTSASGEPLCSYYETIGAWTGSADDTGASFHRFGTEAAFLNGFDAGEVNLFFDTGGGSPRAGEMSLYIEGASIDGGTVPFDEEDFTEGVTIHGVEVAMANANGSDRLETDASLDFFQKRDLSVDITSTWLLDQLVDGNDVDVTVSIKGVEYLQMAVPADGLAAVVDEAHAAVGAVSANLDDGLCGFGGQSARAPRTGQGIIMCALANRHEDGWRGEGAKAAVIPSSMLSSIERELADEGYDISVFEMSMRDIDSALNTLEIIDAVVFYDRDIAEREHPADGGRLVMGRALELGFFQQLLGSSEWFRCEPLIETPACPHPEAEAASIACE